MIAKINIKMHCKILDKTADKREVKVGERAYEKREKKKMA